jgi:hypothetical protein
VQPRPVETGHRQRHDERDDAQADGELGHAGQEGDTGDR